MKIIQAFDVLMLKNRKRILAATLVHVDWST
jgi:hypothetical protein